MRLIFFVAAGLFILLAIPTEVLGAGSMIQSQSQNNSGNQSQSQEQKIILDPATAGTAQKTPSSMQRDQPSTADMAEHPARAGQQGKERGNIFKKLVTAAALKYILKIPVSGVMSF